MMEDNEDFQFMKLTDADFPDVCTNCELCMDQIEQWVTERTNKQIKDQDIATQYI